MPSPFESQANAPARHVPVLLAEVLGSLQPADGDTYADLTFGAGGYSKAMLEAARCRVFAFDRDPEAITEGRALQAIYGNRLQVIESDFASFADVLDERGVTALDGVVMDIGVSSMQIDDPERGFSFLKDGPLDMRMSKSGPSAAEVIANCSAERLADIIYIFGEEAKSRSIARAIVNARRAQAITTTRQLVAAIERATGPHRPPLRTHPATKTFQALRIYVNNELGQLADALLAAEQILKPGGRLVIVTFHSLEDRLAKQFLMERSGNLPGGSRHAPAAMSQRAPSFRLSFKGHVAPQEAERAANPRARSAKLRAAIRTEAPAWASACDFVKSVERLRTS